MNTNKQNTSVKTNTNKSLSSNVKKIANNTANKAKNLAEKAKAGLNNATTKIKTTANQISENVKQKVSNAGNKTNLTEPLTKWSSMTQDFFNSNTAISKFVGFFLCLLLFVIIFQIGMSLINRFIAPSANPYIINGMVESNKQLKVDVNPAVKDSVPIYRSIDQPQGIEYTWNVWFVVDNEISIRKNARIFSKSPSPSSNYNSSYMKENVTQKFVNSSPGLFLSKKYLNYTEEQDNDQDTIYTKLNETVTDSIRSKLLALGTRYNTLSDSSTGIYKSNYATISLLEYNALLNNLSKTAIDNTTTANGIIDDINDIQTLISNLYPLIQSSNLYALVNKVYMELDKIKSTFNGYLIKLKGTNTTSTNITTKYTELSAIVKEINSTLIVPNSLASTTSALDYATNAAFKNKEDITTDIENTNKPIQYNLTLVMNTFDNKNDPNRTLYEKVIIENIPIQKWVCCTIRVQGVAVDVYINGMLKKRQNLNNVPKQNFYDIYIGEKDGFKGYISSLKYYSYAINYNEVQSLFLAGPSLKMLSNDMPSNKNDYLSVNWYFK